MKLKPLHNIIVIEKIAKSETTPAGIVLIGTGDKTTRIGKVLAVGPGVFDEKGKLRPCGVEIGDRIAYNKDHVKDFKIDGETVTCLQAAGILGIFPK